MFHSPQQKHAQALEATSLLPEAAATQLLAKQNEKRKKKHATDKSQTFE